MRKAIKQMCALKRSSFVFFMIVLACVMPSPAVYAQGNTAPEKTLIDINEISEEPETWQSYVTYHILTSTLFVLVDTVNIEVIKPITPDHPYEEVVVTVKVLESYRGDQAPGSLVSFMSYSEDGQTYEDPFADEPLIIGVCQFKDDTYGFDLPVHYPWQEVKDHALAINEKYQNSRAWTRCL